MAYTFSVQFKIYDVSNNKKNIVVKYQQPGNYEVEFNTKNLSTGIYFYKLKATPIGGQAGEFIQTKKIILLK
jgi:hypothetical protein